MRSIHNRWSKKFQDRFSRFDTILAVTDIENYTIQSGAHDFLLTFHSNHRPISHRFRDKRRYPSKIANFPHPREFNAPDEGVPRTF